MDPFTAAAGFVGLAGTIVGVLVGLIKLFEFYQDQNEKRQAKRQNQVAKTDAPPPAEEPARVVPPPAPLPPAPHVTVLPAEATPLIGREQEVNAICTLLQRSEVRLVTLVGPPGAGKTRLGVKVAATLVDDYPDGVFFVALAALREAALAAPTISQVLGVAEVPGQSPAETLKRALRDQQTLLVLDNFEQVMPAAPLVTELLAAAPRLEVLVTSREPLHVSGEHEFAVPPLALPDRQSLASPELIAQSPAVALFVQRTQAVQPHFHLTAENAAAVAELCTLLDGLPLAIELAAARTKLFGPQQLLARLESRFQWLTSGARDLAAHQRTLLSTLDWSYNLLDPPEQTLLRRLGVFVGGCSFEAVESVCQVAGENPIDLWEGLASLIDKSLLQREEGSEGEPRFVMLETIHEYARTKLAESGEAANIRSQHLTYYLRMAEAAEPRLWGEPRPLDQVEQEYDNLRGALGWANERHDTADLAGLVLALFPFWSIRGYWREGVPWVEAVLAQRERLAPATQGTMLNIYAELLRTQGQYGRAEQICEEAVALWQTLDDSSGLAWAVNRLAETRQDQGDYAQAEALWEESLRIYGKPGEVWVLYGLGNTVRLRRDYDRAQAILEECLALARAQGLNRDVSWSLTRLGQIKLAQGNDEQAAALLKESLAGYKELRQRHGLAESLVALGSVALVQQQPVRAAQLFGAADRLLAAIGWHMDPNDNAEYAANVAAARAAQGDERFNAAWAAGQVMTLDQVVDYALAETPESTNALPGDAN